jgi:hypothetical protein
MTKGTFEVLQKPLNALCFCVPGPERGGQTKMASYGSLQIFKNVVQTIGSHNWTSSGVPAVQSGIRNGGYLFRGSRPAQATQPENSGDRNTFACLRHAVWIDQQEQ